MRKRITYPNVMATIAVFLVLGGGAYAATQLPKNSVGSRQLKNGSITPAKLNAATRAALKGPPGPAGAAGAPGAPGATQVTVRAAGTFSAGHSIASCNAGEVATGGGGWVKEEEAKAWIRNSTPLQGEGTPTGWEVRAANFENSKAEVEAYVICASP